MGKLIKNENTKLYFVIGAGPAGLTAGFKLINKKTL